jgi:hypothetical protein
LANSFAGIKLILHIILDAIETGLRALYKEGKMVN